MGFDDGRSQALKSPVPGIGFYPVLIIPVKHGLIEEL
jgi:hypothetical protein